MLSGTCNHNEWMRHATPIGGGGPGSPDVSSVHLSCRVCYRDVVYETVAEFEAKVPPSHIVGRVEEAPKKVLHLRNVPTGISSDDIKRCFEGRGWGILYVVQAPERRQAHVEFRTAADAALVGACPEWDVYVHVLRTPPTQRHGEDADAA